MHSRILEEIAVKSVELDRQSSPFTNSREARDELQRRLGRVSKAIGEIDHLETRRQLVTLLAQGLRMVRDCGLETEADAVRHDDAGLDLGTSKGPRQAWEKE